ncbi:(Na+)-NQR maturation NqrM [Ferrimonas aestuarii]|uniref:(Na+)-NQR maturation NqrM n=1 Tax=Ferrimonas aestuarii TaxID=2569539 RepID=A0A4V5NX57_9GAMM|nr:(Na+)-NQR maturation NqrM [Ferrimonas aestuarii]TKB49613.1 (Na+)-NQR maturation NqrM [Ferrimonas aestuarii]
MQTFIATFAMMLLLVAMMAVGFIIKRKTISGSCGGLGSVGVDKACDCPEPCDKRKAKMAEQERQQKLTENRII